MVDHKIEFDLFMTMTTDTDKRVLDHASLTQFHAEPAVPFAIGLKPLAGEKFLQIDHDHLPYRQQKQELYATHHDEVCMAETDTLSAQMEIAVLIKDCLQRHYPDLYVFDGDTATCQLSGEVFPLNRQMPISSAALLVPEDLILMSRDDSGWRLVGASLAFPASWSLAEKFSRPLEAVHGPVPLSDKMHLRINRIFDSIQPTIPVWRTNWSLDGDGELRQVRLEGTNRKKGHSLTEQCYFRTEFQTLHKLPESGDILFTVRTKSRPVAALLNDQNGCEKLAALHQQYLAMNDAERDYKGINHNADGLLDWLEENGKT